MSDQIFSTNGTNTAQETNNISGTQGEIPKGTTILVVEDNVSNFVLIARMLGYMGIHCEWKTSGYEVVEYADTLPRLDFNSYGYSTALRRWIWRSQQNSCINNFEKHLGNSGYC